MVRSAEEKARTLVDDNAISAQARARAKEVNAAAEDNGNKAADVETGTALKDTVEFVESKKEESGETYEEAAARELREPRRWR